MEKIALGGGCHWCTEVVFQSLKGVNKVEQGFVSSTGIHTSFSEAVVVHFNPGIITLKDLVEIHLHTHKSTSNHSMRSKYRSAIYTFSNQQLHEANAILNELQAGFKDLLITNVLPFNSFKPSTVAFHNYYYSNPEKPFCQNYIDPKIKLLFKKFSIHAKANSIADL